MITWNIMQNSFKCTVKHYTLFLRTANKSAISPPLLIKRINRLNLQIAFCVLQKSLISMLLPHVGVCEEHSSMKPAHLQQQRSQAQHGLHLKPVCAVRESSTDFTMQVQQSKSPSVAP